MLEAVDCIGMKDVHLENKEWKIFCSNGQGRLEEPRDSTGHQGSGDGERIVFTKKNTPSKFYCHSQKRINSDLVSFLLLFIIIFTSSMALFPTACCATKEKFPSEEDKQFRVSSTTRNRPEGLAPQPVPPQETHWKEGLNFHPMRPHSRGERERKMPAMNESKDFLHKTNDDDELGDRWDVPEFADPGERFRDWKKKRRYVDPKDFQFVNPKPADLQIECIPLRSKRYFSDGFCTSIGPVGEHVCTGRCLPIGDLPWYAEYIKVWSRAKTHEYRCVEDVVVRRKIPFVCHNGQTRTYTIPVVQNCKCKRYDRNQNRTPGRRLMKHRKPPKTTKMKDKEQDGVKVKRRKHSEKTRPEENLATTELIRIAGTTANIPLEVEQSEQQTPHEVEVEYRREEEEEEEMEGSDEGVLDGPVEELEPVAEDASEVPSQTSYGDSSVSSDDLN